MEKLKAKLAAKIDEIFFSKKTWGTVAIIVVAVAEDHGLISPPAAMKIQVALGLYVGGVAITDIGKEKAKIESDAKLAK